MLLLCGCIGDGSKQAVAGVSLSSRIEVDCFSGAKKGSLDNSTGLNGSWPLCTTSNGSVSCFLWSTKLNSSNESKAVSNPFDVCGAKGSNVVIFLRASGLNGSLGSDFGASSAILLSPLKSDRSMS